jgi:phospholipid-binding lipoprotein MlaA
MVSFAKRMSAAAVVALAGCATVPAGNEPNAADPWEGFNRTMFQFNEGLATVLLKPVASAYQAVMPRLAREGIGNFFANLAEPWTAVNAALQGKGEASLQTLMRFSFNTVFGFAGVLDIAGSMGIEKRSEDFGQTLGYWGVGSGPYVVLPFVGPSTLRDGLALVPDYLGDPLYREPNLATRDTAAALRLVDTRASLLSAGRLLDEAALDKYSFVRDSFLQRRQVQVTDGND